MHRPGIVVSAPETVFWGSAADTKLDQQNLEAACSATVQFTALHAPQEPLHTTPNSCKQKLDPELLTCDRRSSCESPGWSA